MLEGSVRLAESRLRITVQLINVADGFHLWSARYDKEMGDVFEEDPFGGLLGGEGKEAEEGRTLGRLRRMLPPTHDPELYEL